MTRVLVVDDDVQVRTYLRMVLKSADYEVAEAGNGDEAVEGFRRQRADVVLCDLFMPGRDGLEAIRHLRGEFADVRIVAMSGGALGGRLDLLPVADFFGAVALLRKPFDRATVLAAVERALCGPGIEHPDDPSLLVIA
jgi:CheY-like chemotaxis protein